MKPDNVLSGFGGPSLPAGTVRFVNTLALRRREKLMKHSIGASWEMKKINVLFLNLANPFDTPKGKIY